MKKEQIIKKTIASFVVTSMLVTTNTSFVIAESNMNNEEYYTETVVLDETTVDESQGAETYAHTHYATSSSPSNGATNVPTNLQTVSFIFDYPLPNGILDASSDVSVYIDYYDGYGNYHHDSWDRAKVTWGINVVNINVSEYEFLSNTEYTVTLHIDDFDINPMTGMKDNWEGSTTFTTAPISNGPAQVVGTTPNLDNTSVSKDVSKIKITFDKPMNTSKVGSVTIQDVTSGEKYMLDMSHYYWEDNKNCVVDLNYTTPYMGGLESKHYYEITINNFEDMDRFITPTKTYSFVAL